MQTDPSCRTRMRLNVNGEKSVYGHYCYKYNLFFIKYPWSMYLHYWSSDEVVDPSEKKNHEGGKSYITLPFEILFFVPLKWYDMYHFFHSNKFQSDYKRKMNSFNKLLRQNDPIDVHWLCAWWVYNFRRFRAVKIESQTIVMNTICCDITYIDKKNRSKNRISLGNLKPIFNIELMIFWLNFLFNC